MELVEWSWYACAIALVSCLMHNALTSTASQHRAHREVGGVGEQDGPAAVDPLMEGGHVALCRLR